MKPEVGEEIEALAYVVKTLHSDEKSSKAISMLGNVIRSGSEGGVALLALTELSVLLERFPKIRNKDEIGKTPFIDALQVYAEKFADLYLDALPKTESFNKEDAWI